mmetsp:Transcript_5307/g.9518  ORF Transcript_5307/g.9518 Transcript_5307/m.9518 type:complete len:437 (+) Transcript_5307:2218-3528(+)
MSEGIAFHDEVQVVDAWDSARLLTQLPGVSKESLAVVLVLTLRDAKLLHASDLFHGKLDCFLPVLWLRRHSQGGDRASLPSTVAEIQVEGGDLELLVARKVGVQPEFQDTQDDTPDEGPLQVAQVSHTHDRKLAEHVDAELVQKRVPEYRRLHRPRQLGRLLVRPLPGWAVGSRVLVDVSIGMFHRRPHQVPGCRHLLPLLHFRRQVSESFLDELLHFLRGRKVSDHVQGRVRWKVPLVVKLHEVLSRPPLYLLLETNRKPAPESVFLVQVSEELHVNPVIDCVHHLHLGEDSPPLLLQPGWQQVRLERNLPQSVQHLREHWPPVGGIHVRGVDVKHGVVEVRVSVRPRSRPKQALPLSRAEKRHVLHQVSQSLLPLVLIHAADMHLQVSLETLRGHLVWKHHVSQAVRLQDSPMQVRVLGQRQRQVALSLLAVCR